jgi:hypothetical protein
MLSSSCFSYLLIVGKHVWRPLLLDDRQMAGAIDQYITPLIFLHMSRLFRNLTKRVSEAEPLASASSMYSFTSRGNCRPLHDPQITSLRSSTHNLNLDHQLHIPRTNKHRGRSTQRDQSSTKPDNQLFSDHEQAHPKHKTNMAPALRTRNPRWRQHLALDPPPSDTQGANASPAHLTAPDLSAPEEHPMALAIREKPKPRRMNLPLRTMAQTSGITKKGPGKDAPSRPVPAERIEYGLAVAYLGDNINAVISEANPRLALDSPPRSGTVAPRPTHRMMMAAPRVPRERELRYLSSATERDLDRRRRDPRDPDEATVDRTCYLLVQIHRHTLESPEEPTLTGSADAEMTEYDQPVTEGVSCADYQQHNRRKYNDNSRANLKAHEWGRHQCDGCRELITSVRYECRSGDRYEGNDCFNLCHCCFLRPTITRQYIYTR